MCAKEPAPNEDKWQQHARRQDREAEEPIARVELREARGRVVSCQDYHVARRVFVVRRRVAAWKGKVPLYTPAALSLLGTWTRSPLNTKTTRSTSTTALSVPSSLRRLRRVDKRGDRLLRRPLQHAVPEVEEVLPRTARVGDVLVHRLGDLLLAAE